MWRPMQQSDLPDVCAVSDAVHGSFTEVPAVYGRRLMLHPGGCFVFDQGGAISGYLIGHPWYAHKAVPLGAMPDVLPADSGVYYLHDIALLPDARGTGAGKAALMLAQEDARHMRAREMALVAVNGADAFWRKCGFEYVEDAEIAAELLRGYGDGVFYMTVPVPFPEAGR